MSLTASTQIESVRVRPGSGCGTVESPWRGWEDEVESALRGHPRTFLFGAGFWGVARCVRLGSGVMLGPEHAEDGRAWFLPVEDLESLFLVDGTHEVAVHGLGLEGRDGRARHGIVLRCGTRLEVRGCRFDDFSARDGSALRIAGESTDRWVRGVVVEGCTFLNGRVGLSIERDARDLLVTGNRFEEFTGPSIRVDPRGEAVDYGALLIKNRIRALDLDRREPLVRIGSGAQDLRLAENTLEGPDTHEAPAPNAAAGIELQGSGRSARLRLEVLLNTFAAVRGPAIEARDCGPGLQASGNRITGCGTSHLAAVDLTGCQGALVQDNEIHVPRGTGLRLADCRRVRAHGNEIRGAGGDTSPRSAGTGILVDGDSGHRLRASDNRVSGARDTGIEVRGGTGVRLVGNEVQDCGEGIVVRDGRAVVLVGNDCRDHRGWGIVVEAAVRSGLVALNHAAANGRGDLDVRGTGVRCRANKVDRPA